MMINKENYELYAIDYLDNNLEKERNAEMILFLSNHPEINDELELMKSPVIMTADNTIKYTPKSELKKEENKTVIWLPTLMKYAAAILLLVSISSVWFLNTENNTNSITEIKEIETPLNNSETAKLENPDPIKEEGIVAKINKPEPVKTTKIIASQKPKQINNPIKQVTGPITPTTDNILVASNTEPTLSIGEKIEPITSKTKNPKEPITVHEDNRTKLSTEPINVFAELTTTLSTGSIKAGIYINPPTINTINIEPIKKKGSWFINALTTKSDGTKIFAFEGVKRALIPTRLRDVTVDKSSTDSPLKQFTHD